MFVSKKKKKSVVVLLLITVIKRTNAHKRHIVLFVAITVLMN